jgi:peptidoglycan/xylan/chitin deacetylase (PgdA/CDA1 family)
MRRDKVLRFLGIAFVVGAFLGLVSGLAFGGSATNTGTPKLTAPIDSRTLTGAAAPSGATSSTFSGPMTAAKAEAIGANELGQIPVLLYHDISEDGGDDSRTPQDLAKDIALLKSEGFYPVNLRDLAAGNVDIPAGMSPVVLTFDDSSSGQYRILDDGTVDPQSAVGVLQAAADSGGWASRATFYCLLDVASKDKELFGQADRQQEKLRNLVDWGYEVGSHTISNLNLRKADPLEVKKELQESQAKLQDLIGGDYVVTSLSVPSGEYPQDESVLASGTYDGKPYKYTSAVTLGDTVSSSPFSTLFNAMHIPRIAVTGSQLKDAIAALKAHPELRYISDGDPTTVSAPRALAEQLGQVRTDLGRPLIQY